MFTSCFAHSRWFSLGTPAYSIAKTGHHDIAEIFGNQATESKMTPDISHLNCTKREKQMIKELFDKHQDVFTKDDTDLGFSTTLMIPTLEFGSNHSSVDLILATLTGYLF
jgi:hypothetical protein